MVIFDPIVSDFGIREGVITWHFIFIAVVDDIAQNDELLPWNVVLTNNKRQYGAPLTPI